MDNRAIGVFDSGLGGLTAVRELRRLLPNENIVYFGDTGRVPYGSRGKEVIARYAHQDIRFLQSHDVKMIVCACGTVSSVLGKELNEDADQPSTGVLLPAAQAACARSTNGRIGIIGTAATIRSGALEQAIRDIRPDAHIVGNACPLLVPIAEAGLAGTDNPIAREAVAMYLAPLKAEGIDTLVLGCTHFPLFSQLISEYFDHKVTLIDSGQEVARFVQGFMAGHGMLCDPTQQGSCAFYVSDDVEGFIPTAELFLGDSIAQQVSRVSVDTL
ncbi:MAG: glutamate racemase [Oscillospiraceae bacterium]|nr:glutamate racemase [Oscillospiraceae bacterium]